MDVVLHLKQAGSGGWVVQEWRSGLPWFAVPLSSWLAGVGVVDLGGVFRKVLSEHEHGGLGGGDLGDALAQAAFAAIPDPQERRAHDHSGEAMVWCETHQHEHIASIPRFTYLCKDCGWGQWYRDQAREHESATAVSFHHRHETYEVEHVLRPLEGAPSEEQIEFCYCGQTLKREDKIDFYTLKCPKLQCGGFRMVPKRSAGVAPQPVINQAARCSNTIAPVNNGGKWGACDRFDGHYPPCEEFQVDAADLAEVINEALADWQGEERSEVFVARAVVAWLKGGA